MKTKLKYIILSVIVFALIFSLFNYLSHRNTFSSNYEEWADTLGLYNLNALKIETYQENNNEINIDFICNGQEACIELINLVDKHNNFVKDNPDYFHKDMIINFTEDYSANVNAPGMIFSSIASNSTFLDNNVNDIGINYCETSLGTMNSDRWAGDYSINVPNLIINMGSNSLSETKSSIFQFLDNFDGLNRVILKFETEENYTKFCDWVKEYAPNATVDMYYFNEPILQ